ncbi:MAG: biphenyl 2,3-dioxygenase [Verrucomicrobia bacterium]|nr:biphenyl 2,3-dioxygenase [Verrucomicrobiota bacterium]
MRRSVVYSIVASVIGVPLHSSPSQAEGDLTKQQPIEIRIQLGSETDALRFFPDTIRLTTGRLYKLILNNPSPQKHYFSSEGLSQAVFTRKVQINGRDGQPIAEVKGSIREIEVYPNGTAEWWFVPIKAGEFNDLYCTIRGHTEDGMVGKIVIR